MNLPKGDAYAMVFRLEGDLCAVYCTKAENSISPSEAQGFIIQFLANFNNLRSFSVEYWSIGQYEDWINSAS
jgi:hypothetical protein